MLEVEVTEVRCLCGTHVGNVALVSLISLVVR